MPSRKKNRGKQRKAVKQSSNGLAGRASPQAQTLGIKQLKAEGCRVVTSLYGGPTTVRHPIFQHMRLSVGGRTPTAAEWRGFDRGLLSDEERRELAENYVHNYAQGMREGDYHATDVVMRNIEDPHIGPQLRRELAKALALHLSLLHLLNQSDRSVSDVLGRGDLYDADEYIKMPYYWATILQSLAQEGFSDTPRDDERLEVAKYMGSFVMRMMDDKRELFQSNLIWHMCISPFFELMQEILKSKDAFLAMISYEGFLPFIAQASCWSQSREDIVEERRMLQLHHHTSESTLCPDPKSLAGRHAQRVIATILLVHGDDKSAEMRRALDQIACTPLLSDDTECNDSTMAGLVRMLNEKSDEQDRFLFVNIVRLLLLKHGYVDARVIAELIEYGKANHLLETAEAVLNLMVPILGRHAGYAHINMIDSRYAAAVRCGLLEFCIDALVAYGNESDCTIGEDLGYIADGFRFMAMHSKTSRALRKRKEGITTALDKLRKKCGSQFDEICALINYSVEVSAPATCCNCLKEVDRNELLYCKRCGVECYCSLACQSESYELGHERPCREELEIIGGLRECGLSETELKRWKVLGSNLMMNGCRIVREKAAEFLDGVGSITEGTVDFGEYPPVVEVSRSDASESSGSLKFVFTSPVYYGFAEKVGLGEEIGPGEVALEKVISRRSLERLAMGQQQYGVYDT